MTVNPIWTVPGTDIKVRMEPGAREIPVKQVYLTKPDLLEVNCGHCQQGTVSKAQLYALNEDGVALLGTVIRCSNCEGALL